MDRRREQDGSLLTRRPRVLRKHPRKDDHRKLHQQSDNKAGGDPRASYLICGIKVPENKVLDRPKTEETDERRERLVGAASRIDRVNSITCAFEAKLRRNRITPAAAPVPSARAENRPGATASTASTKRCYPTALAQLNEPPPTPPPRLRTAARAYQNAIDDLTQQIGLTA